MKEVSEKKGYKKTKLGWIPKEWEVKRLKQVAKTFSGGTPRSNEKSFFEGKIPFIRSGEINSESTKQFLTEKGLDNSSAKMVSKGDILCALYGANSGEISISKIDGAINQAILCIYQNGKNNYDSIFLMSFLKLEKKAIVAKYLQGGQGNLSAGIINSIKIPIPPLPEQLKIAEILSTWDTAITNTQELIAQLKSRKKGLMQQLLTGQKRLKGFSGEWEEKRLEEFISLTLRPQDKPNSNFLALGLRSHGKGVFHKPNFDPASIAMETLFEVKKDDLVVNITFAWEHAIAIANEIDEGGLVSHRFPTYTFKENISAPLYFRYFVLLPWFKKELGIISPGGAGRNRVMSKKDFPKIEIKIPPFEEQKAISNILNLADIEIKSAENKLTSLQNQKKGLMQQLLTGQKRVLSLITN
jgi:type I restriction enzyme S subunit